MSAATNQNFPHGFKPLNINTAGGPVGVRQYAKAAGDSAAIYAFDLVSKHATSATTEGQLLPDPGCQTYASGTPGTTLILGCSLNYGAASTITWHTVVDDPTALFEAQTTGGTNITVAASVGKNCNVDNTAQTSGTLMSAMGIKDASSGIATTAALDLRLVDFYRAVTNVEGPYAILEVLILKHQYAQGSAGV